MAALERIRTHGFRAWYERQLIECHAWLVSWFLAVIVLVSGLEVFGSREPGGRQVGVVLIVGGGLYAWLAWRRYRAMLLIAEHYGNLATCPGCGVYGRFEVVESGTNPLPDAGEATPGPATRNLWMEAACRKCETHWKIR